jgi:hypothetical protein
LQTQKLEKKKKKKKTNTAYQFMIRNRESLTFAPKQQKPTSQIHLLKTVLILAPSEKNNQA